MSVKNRSFCTGCGLCAYQCQAQAIRMQQNEAGFLCPTVDEKRCVECNLCEKVCPALTRQTSLPKSAYAVQNFDTTILANSSSGGAFSLISDYVLENKGLVFAAAYTKDHEVRCVQAKNAQERDGMRGSIYVQSRICDVFKDIGESVSKQLTLFVGTPCQVAAVKNMFKSIPENLLTVDLFCHGVMSPKILKDYLHKIERESKQKLDRFFFRDKKYGWLASTQSALFSDGKKSYAPKYSAIKHIYHSGNAMRDCCYDCPYTNLQRVGDISIGDMWDLHRFGITNDNRGFSCVLVNTDKGQACFNGIAKAIEIPIDFNKLTQQALTKHITGKENADKFYQNYCKNGFDDVLQNYGQLSNRERVSTLLHRALHIIGVDRLIFRALGK